MVEKVDRGVMGGDALRLFPVQLCILPANSSTPLRRGVAVVTREDYVVDSPHHCRQESEDDLPARSMRSRIPIVANT